MALLSPPRLHDPYRSSPYSTKNGSDQPNQPPIGYVLGKDGLAISSVRAEAGEKGEDGINYLSTVINQGIVTPLMPEYRNAILRKTGGRNLDEAYRLARLGAREEGK